MIRYLSACVLGAVLCAPVVMQADDHHDKDKERRYYDQERKDYHSWNDGENRAYRHWLEERKQSYREFEKMNREQQRTYWKWRHDHPDWDHDRR